MKAKEFESTLRRLVNAEPFQPFAFIMNDGETIVADVPNAVSFGTAAATCVTDKPEIFLLDCENVQEIRCIVPEVAQ